MKKENRQRRKLIFAFVLFLIVFFAPIPYYIEQPGSTIPLSQVITVNDKSDEQPGSFLLTSVGIRQATIVQAVLTKLDPFKELVTKKELYGEATSKEYQEMQMIYMDTSQNQAIEQALKLAKKPYELEFNGVYVMDIQKESNFKDKLSVGDVVTKVNGKSFKSSAAFMKYIQSKKVGEDLTITFVHKGKILEATAPLIILPSTKKPGIGISLIDHTEFKSDEKVTFHLENVGGPSAGMMFTLEIYEQLTGKNLRKGRLIAGTGTMESDGTVGRIGGIDKKVASADQEGVSIFFAPDDSLSQELKDKNPGIQSNYEEALEAAKKLKTKMKIVPVKTVEDAIAYLEKN